MIKLVILSGPHMGKEFELSSGTYIIGRSAECDIAIESEFISKQHASITVTPTAGHPPVVIIEDLHSRNGTFVNGMMIQKADLKSGDRISFQDVVLELKKPLRADALRADALRAGAVPQAVQPEQTKDQPAGRPAGLEFRGLGAGVEAVSQMFTALLEKVSEKIEWKFVTLFLVLILVTLSFFSLTLPLMNQAKVKLQAEALKRAELIVKRTARENQKNIHMKDGTLLTETLELTTAFSHLEERILSLNIIDPKTKRILAPAERLGQTISEGPILKGTEAKNTSIEKLDAETILISEPIYVYDDAASQEVVGAIVQAEFSVEGIGFSSGESMGLLIRSFIIFFFLGIGFYTLLGALTRTALKKIDDEIETAARLGYRHLELKTKFGEISSVIHSINTLFRQTRELLTKLPEESRGKAVIEDTDAILKNLLTSVPEGVAILNGSYQILHINPAFQKLTGVQLDARYEENILNIVQDQEFLRNMTHGLEEVGHGYTASIREEFFMNQEKFHLLISGEMTPQHRIEYYVLQLRQVK